MRRSKNGKAIRGSIVVGCGLLMLTACSSGGAGSAVSPDSTSGPSTEVGKIMSEAEWAEVVEAAKQEGEVVVYGTMNAALTTLLPQEFEKAYPEIDVTYVRLSPADVEARLGAEIASGNVVADAVDNLQNIVVDGFADQGALLPLNVPAVGVPEFDRPVNQRTPFSAYIGTVPYGWAWNTNLLPEGITSWEDYLELDPSLVGATDPSIGPAVASLYMATEDLAGEGFLDKLLAGANPKIYPGSNPAVTSLAAGEIAAVLPVPVANVITAQQGGSPIDFTLYEGSYTIPTELAVLDGPHPNAARVWANWFLSEEGQKVVGQGGQLPILPVPTLYDTEGIELVRDKPLPQDEFVAFQRRWAELVAG